MSEPPARGARPRRVVAPRGPGRRSQAEREARSLDEKDRTKLRNEEFARQQKALKAQKDREDRMKAQRLTALNRRGRGGFMGEVGGRVEGPLSKGSVIAPSRSQTYPRNWAPSKRGRTGAAKAFGGVKKEGAATAASRDTQGASIQQEEDEEESEEDDGEGPRVDVDQFPIYISSDDEDTATGDVPRSAFQFAPVRVDRVEHLDRKPQLNADGSVTIKKQESEDVDLSSIPAVSNRKGKQRARDVEITGAQEIWRPVYDDDDDVSIVKQEEPTTTPLGNIPASRNRSSTTDREREKSTKPRVKKKPIQDEKFTTKEEREEYDRHQHGLETLVDELGSVHVTDTSNADNKDKTIPEALLDKKADRVYLFQFPPVVPNLNAQQSDKDITMAGAEASQETESKTDVDAKNEATLKDNSVETVEQIGTKLGHLPKLDPGRVGKLRVYKSGKAAIDWGGSPLQLQMGISPFFLEDVILTRLKAEVPAEPANPSTSGSKSKKKEVDNFSGEAMAFGQVRGKFVVTPDWDVLLPS